LKFPTYNIRISAPEHPASCFLHDDLLEHYHRQLRASRAQTSTTYICGLPNRCVDRTKHKKGSSASAPPLPFISLFMYRQKHQCCTSRSWLKKEGKCSTNDDLPAHCRDFSQSLRGLGHGRRNRSS